jgi:hypothetical protein
MSNPDVTPTQQERPEAERQGPSLVLMYGLVALALVLAVGFAALIVLPFHLRR